MSFGSPIIDLTGKLIIKAQLGSDIRKIPIHNEEITYDELLLMMQRLFSGKIKSSDDVLMKYKDEDGDLITLYDSSDLMFAKSLSRYLKLTLTVNGKPQPLQDDQIKEIKSELTVCRDRINELMTRLDLLAEVAPSSRDESLPRDPEQRQQTNEPVRENTNPTSSQVNQQREEQILANRANAALFDPIRKTPEPSQPDSTSKDPFANIGASQPPRQQSYSPVSSSTNIQQQQQQPAPQQQQQAPAPTQSSTYNPQQQPTQSYSPAPPSNQQQVTSSTTPASSYPSMEYNQRQQNPLPTQPQSAPYPTPNQPPQQSSYNMNTAPDTTAAPVASSMPYAPTQPQQYPDSNVNMYSTPTSYPQQQAPPTQPYPSSTAPPPTQRYQYQGYPGYQQPPY